jgi:glycosyltransferase 2 family protein
MRRALLLFIKAAISILLLYLSLRWGNVSAIGERLGRLQPGWIVLGLGLLTTQIVLLAFRWRIIAVASGASLAFVPALQFSFIAAFFNQVLPSTVGGDGARIWLLARRGAAGWARATYSVLTDRIVGVFALALVVIVCLPWTFELIHDPIARAILLLTGFGTVAGAVVFVSIGSQFKELTDRWALTRHLAAASRVAATMCVSLRSFAAVIACSIVIHLFTIAAAWCCAKAIAAPVSLSQILFLLPPVLLVSSVPISIAGWGVRETSMIAAFGFAGLAEGDGLTLSVLFGAASSAVGVIGGIVWIMSGLRIRSFTPAVADAEVVADNP